MITFPHTDFLIIPNLNIRPHTHTLTHTHTHAHTTTMRDNHVCDLASVYEQMLIIVKLPSPLAAFNNNKNTLQHTHTHTHTKPP